MESQRSERAREQRWNRQRGLVMEPKEWEKCERELLRLIKAPSFVNFKSMSREHKVLERKKTTEGVNFKVKKLKLLSV